MLQALSRSCVLRAGATVVVGVGGECGWCWPGLRLALVGCAAGVGGVCGCANGSYKRYRAFTVESLVPFGQRVPWYGCSRGASWTGMAVAGRAAAGRLSTLRSCVLVGFDFVSRCALAATAGEGPPRLQRGPHRSGFASSCVCAVGGCGPGGDGHCQTNGCPCSGHLRWSSRSKSLAFRLGAGGRGGPGGDGRCGAAIFMSGRRRCG